MIELPTQKINASRKNPRKIILFGKPKIGKSTALANLDNCLILDLEGGTDYLEALKIDIIKKYQPYFDNIEEIIEFIDDLRYPQGIYNMVRDYVFAMGG